MGQTALVLTDSFASSRLRFRRALERIRAGWPSARLHTHSYGGDDDLSTDWIEAPPSETAERLLFVTSGEHGIEGFVGAAVLEMLIDEYLDRLDPRRTGLLLLHAINPWGMQHRRRTNSANVDLNRNFVRSADELDPTLNPEYDRLEALLNPARRLRQPAWAKLTFLAGLAGHVLRMGPTAVQSASLQGQYRHRRGLYYGGDAVQAETRLLMDLYHRAPEPYARVVHLDMHTGYGPARQMTIVNSALEPRPSHQVAGLLDYPRVVKATQDEFYPIRGDMVDYVYRLFQDEYPGKRLYSAAFEFGTLGEGLPSVLLSLRTMIWENQLHHHGADGPAVERVVQGDFGALFAPDDPAWQAKAAADARRALSGILRAEGFLAS